MPMPLADLSFAGKPSAYVCTCLLTANLVVCAREAPLGSASNSLQACVYVWEIYRKFNEEAYMKGDDHL